MVRNQTGSRQGAGTRVGVRLRGEVERTCAALGAATAAVDTRPPFSRGALAAYLWALGRAAQAPVTGASLVGPDVGRLTAEVDASLVRLDDPTLPETTREYLEGAHQAFAWLCGHSDTPP